MAGELIPLPDGGAVRVREGETPDQAWARAMQSHPEAFGIEQKHGFIEATKAGAKSGVGAGIRYLGNTTGNQAMEQYGQNMTMPSQEPGAYHPYTDEEEKAKWDQGFFPGLGASWDKHVGELGGGVVGRFGIPMAVGAAAAPLAVMAAPELAIAGVGAGALGSGLGFVAANTPMAAGEDMQRQDEVNQARVEQGLAPRQYDLATTTMHALVQSAIMPVLGGIGNKLVTTPIIKAMGGDIAAVTKAVESGTMTREVGVAKLNGIAKNMLAKTTEMAAVGPAMMVGDEALRTRASGEDMDSPEAIARYEESIKGGLAAAPVFGAFGAMGMRRPQVKAVNQAADKYDGQYADAMHENAWRDGRGTQMGLDLGTPEQPKGGFQGNTAPGATDVITPEFFDQHGIPNKGKGKELRKRYEGVPLNDVDGLSALYAELEPLANSKVPEAAAYARVAGTIEPAIKAAQAREPDQRNWIDERYVDNMKAGRERAVNVRKAQANNQERIDYGNQKAAEQVNQAQVETAALNARTQTKQEDMFNHSLSRDDMSKPEPEIVASPRELADRKAEAYEEFQKAYEHYQKTGDDAALTEIVARAKEDLGAYDEHLNQQSTRALFDKNGRPTPGARVKDVAPAPEGKDRASDAVPVSGKTDVGVGEAPVDAVGARPSVPVNERPVVGEKRVDRPVEKTISVATRVKREAPMRAEAAKKATIAEQLAATDSQKKESKRAAEAKDAEQYLPEATTTGIGRAGKATAVEEFAPAHFKLDSPEHLGKDGTPNHGMQALWWNDLAQMASDMKHGTAAEKKVAREVIKQGRKNKTITTEQMERAVAEDKKNIELLKKYKRKAVFERVAAAREEQKAALSGEKSRQKELRDAKKTIADFERKEAERKAKEEQVDREAEKRMTKPEEKTAERDTDAEPLSADERRRQMIDPDAFMYRKGADVKPTRTKDGAEQMVKNITGKWTNAPKVQVKDMADLTAAERTWVEKNDAKGFIEKETGDIVIISDRNADLHDVKATLFHEALGHYGLRSKFGTELNNMLQGMYDTNPAMRKLADAQRVLNPKLTKPEAVEEVLAEAQVSQTKPVEGMRQGFVAKFARMIRDFARKMGMKLEWNNNDIAAVRRAAFDEVVAGTKRDGKVTGEQAARVVTAPESPDNAAPKDPKPPSGGGSIKVLAKDMQDKPFKDRMLELIGAQEGGVRDRFGNAFLGNTYSAKRKVYERGETGGMSKINKGRVSIEGGVAQGNNAIGIVSRAMEVGHMVIDKAGRIMAKRDKENNIEKLKDTNSRLRAALVKKGYTEKPKDAEDPNTVTNALAYALFGPRLEALVKIDQFSKANYGPAEKALSDKLRADPELKPHIEEFHKVYNTMRSHALDALVESGTFTPAKAKEFMDRTEYLPLYRIDEQLTTLLGEPTHVNSLLATAKEHHLGYGSDLMIGDPVVNAFNNLTWLNIRAVKNNTANLIAESLVAVNSAKWQKYKGAVNDKHVLELLVKGESKFLRVEDINDVSAFTAAPVMTGIGWNIARMFSNTVRKGVTLMPGFVWGQTSQDAQRVAIMTGEGYAKSYANVASGLVRNFTGETKEADILRAYGVAGARDFVDSFDNFRKDMLENERSPWWKAYEQLERLATASDLAAREAAYKKRFAKAIQEGMSNADAEFEAQHAARMLIDFNNRGNSRTLAALMTVVPFVNARIQGSHRMLDALRGKIPGMDKAEAQKMAMMQVGKLMAFTLAYSLYKKDDDEYENQTTIVRNNNFMLGAFNVPVAGEMLPFKVIAETTARQMMDAPGEDWSKSRGSIAGALSSVLLGPSDMVPSLARPIVEAATNHSFATGRELVGRGMANASPKNQYTNSSTALTKAISAGIQDTLEMLGIHESGVSPIVLENFITGWTGRAGQEALNLMRNLESGFGDRARPKRNEWVGFGAFTTNPEGNSVRGDFQEVVNRVNAAHADLKILKDAGRGKEAAEFIRENRKILALQSRLYPIQQRLAAISKQEKRGDHTAATRDRLYKQKLDALRQGHELRKAAGF